ncbi:hypothetical protein EDB85DRAFT_2278181 [Lactarius pseudohatsudake]|nr:hypothetical protein EDB85DRAFT_2278181 [Lactarius pseudohatsudake]
MEITGPGIVSNRFTFLPRYGVQESSSRLLRHGTDTPCKSCGNTTTAPQRYDSTATSTQHGYTTTPYAVQALCQLYDSDAVLQCYDTDVAPQRFDTDAAPRYYDITQCGNTTTPICRASPAATLRRRHSAAAQRHKHNAATLQHQQRGNTSTPTRCGNTMTPIPILTPTAARGSERQREAFIVYLYNNYITHILEE